VGEVVAGPLPKHSGLCPRHSTVFDGKYGERKAGGIFGTGSARPTVADISASLSIIPQGDVEKANTDKAELSTYSQPEKRRSSKKIRTTTTALLR